LNQQVGINKDY